MLELRWRRLHETTKSITVKVFKPCHYELRVQYPVCVLARIHWPYPCRGEGAELEWQQQRDALAKCFGSRAVCTRQKKCWWESSMPENGDQTWENTTRPNHNQTRLKMDGSGTRTGTSLSYLGQSSPSSGVISVSLCTTTLVTDMSGCCSLASFMAWARAYIRGVQCQEGSPGGDRK